MLVLLPYKSSISTLSILSDMACQFAIFIASSFLMIHPTPAAACFSFATPLYISVCPSSRVISPFSFFFVSVIANTSSPMLSNSSASSFSFPLSPLTFHVPIFLVFVSCFFLLLFLLFVFIRVPFSCQSVLIFSTALIFLFSFLIQRFLFPVANSYPYRSRCIFYLR